MPLTATALKQAKPRDRSYKLSDGGGLYLLVTKAGAKYWRFKYRFAGKEKVLALGVYPDITLAKARKLHESARELLGDGVDPGEHRRAQKAAGGEAAANSFRTVAQEWFEKKMTGKSKSHRERTWRALEKYLFPTLGKRPVGSITPPELLAVLRKIEARGILETARRVKQAGGQVFRYAVATGRAERDPSQDLAGALATPTPRHLPSITEPREVGKLLVAIDQYNATPVVMTALKLSPLLFCRPGELRHMEWCEINWEQSRWELPADKMKIRQPHIVPLSKQALELLTAIKPLTGRGRYVFPSARGASRPLSENGVRVALRTMGYDNETITPHGFRAMARTLLDEVLGYRIEWIECQLAHAVKDANGRAYNRTTYLKQRSEMMQKWADYLEALKAEAIDNNALIAYSKS